MRRFDRSPQAVSAAWLGHHGLDGHLLQLQVAVHEAGSVTGAAQRLGVTLSAVSHLLDKLRGIVGDRLIVKSGRGIVATATAELLAPRARLLLDELRDEGCQVLITPPPPTHHTELDPWPSCQPKKSANTAARAT